MELWKKTKILWQEGNIDELMNTYRELVHQGELKAHWYLAYLYYAEKEDYQQALGHLEQIYPQYPQASYNIAMVYWRMKRIRECVYYLKAAIHAGVPEAHLQRGYIHECLQEYVEAIMQYQIAVYKGLPHANLLLAQLYESMSDWERAGDYYEAVRQHGMEQWIQNMNLHKIPGGQTAWQIDDYCSQLRNCQTTGFWVTGRSCQEEGRYLDAALNYEQAIDHGDERGEAGFHELFSAMSNDQERLPLIKELLHHGSREGYYFLAEYYVDHNDLKRALIAIRKYNEATNKQQKKGMVLLNTIFEKLASADTE
ncbi:MAG: hypothetical protein HQM12_11395 [SAR324 cluster bacterium]|nr:hypothetical protein [SAR324 cluster bacterium]